jgi:hypothetical protein
MNELPTSGAGKGSQRRNGENIKKFDKRFTDINWNSKKKGKKK